jgi:hypothetical protein
MQKSSLIECLNGLSQSIDSFIMCGFFEQKQGKICMIHGNKPTAKIVYQSSVSHFRRTGLFTSSAKEAVIDVFNKFLGAFQMIACPCQDQGYASTR